MIRDYALAANERTKGELIADEDHEHVEKMLRSDRTGQDGMYITAVSNPSYRGSFTKFLQHGDKAGMYMNEAERLAMVNVEHVRTAMSEGSAALGAALVPFALDPTIVLTNTGVFPNSIRDITRVETINTSAAHYVTSAGVTAEWVSEAAEATDASPSFAQPTITPVRADAYCQASYELVQDSNVADQLVTVFADAKMRLEEAAFAVGTGTTQPFGIVTRLQATTASRVECPDEREFRVDRLLRGRQHATHAVPAERVMAVREMGLQPGPKLQRAEQHGCRVGGSRSGHSVTASRPSDLPVRVDHQRRRNDRTERGNRVVGRHLGSR